MNRVKIVRWGACSVNEMMEGNTRSAQGAAHGPGEPMMFCISRQRWTARGEIGRSSAEDSFPRLIGEPGSRSGSVVIVISGS
jgi:hypothetical protein